MIKMDTMEKNTENNVEDYQELYKNAFDENGNIKNIQLEIVNEDRVKRGEEPIKEIQTLLINQVELPCNNRNNRDFALDIADAFKNSELIYFKPNENHIIEIAQYFDKYSKKNLTGFCEVVSTRLMNVIDTSVMCYKNVYSKDEGMHPIKKTPNDLLVKYLLFNDDFKNALNKVNRLLHVRMPFLIDDKLLIPKLGHNAEIDAFVSSDAEEIIDMEFDEAKDLIKSIFKEFCFKEEIDRTMAIAGLITPGCRGLYKRVTCRTPIFLYIANRERAGKDFCAGITGIIYEGHVIDNPPISSDDKQQNNSEELRKKLTSSLKHGTRRLHFSNNRGKIKNAVLEQVTTSEYWQDRVLGRNEEITLPNEIDFSLSANMGLSWTPDFWNRCRPINLFLAQEDPNNREFDIPDLHGWVKQNRSRIQSAIITIIKEWYNAGQPSGQTFTSFPEWARVVGGIMEFCEFGNPCTSIIDDSVVGGDTETINFKELFEIMHEHQTKTLQCDNTKKEIMQIISKKQEEGDDLFAGWDFENRSTQTSFAKNFEKFIGRVLSGIKLVICKNNARSSRITYSFIKEGGNLVTSGNLLHAKEQNKKNLYNGVKNDANVTDVTKTGKNTPKKDTNEYNPYTSGEDIIHASDSILDKEDM